MTLFPLLISEAPPVLRFGVYAISAFALAYFFGGRYILNDKGRNDIVAALVILVGTAVLTFILFDALSLKAVLDYVYGMIIGGSLVYLLLKYHRLNQP